MTAATDWNLWSTQARLVVTDERLLGAARAVADDILTRIDTACSRFRSDSELNRIAPYLPQGVDVSEILALLIRRALDAAAATDGDVDPTLGYALSAVGYDRDISLVIDSDTIVRAIASPRPGWRSVRLVGRRLRVPAHLALDLGATAKAVAADLAASAIAEQLGCGVLMSIGGDIATAGPAPEKGWRLLVQDRPGDPATRVVLAEGFGMATSSTQKRRWVRGGEEIHHILDPRTGMPAEPFWRSVTVAAPDCFTANTFSTAAIVRGAEAVSFLRNAGLSARLVARSGEVTVIGGWPAEPAQTLEKAAA
jgi:thiamine biosynthesis lipoprotein